MSDRDFVIRKLARKSYCSWELKQKCREIPEIDQILVEFAEKGYLNDQEWLRGFVRQEEAKGSSPLAIAFKMRNKGIPRNIIEAALADLSPEASLERAIAKKSRGKVPDRQKLIASLQRQGFSWDLVKSKL